MPFGKEQILKKYQEISQIENLRSLIIENQNRSFDQQQQQCKEFIQQVEQQKDRNTQLFQDLLNQCEKVQDLVNFDKLNENKQLLLDFIDSINIFNQQNESQIISDNNLRSISQQNQENGNLDKLMQLISNKTNYCSEQFLLQIRQKMQKLNYFLNQISFEKMNQENKQLTRFSQLSNQNIERIYEYVEHIIQMQNTPQYVQSVKNSDQVLKLKNIFDSELNFINDKYRDNFMDYFIETYTFQKQLRALQMHYDEQNFNQIRKLERSYVKKIINLVEKKQYFDHNKQNFQNSLTQKAQKAILKQSIFDKNELETTLEQFPIFDLLQQLKQINILNELQLIKSNLQDGNQHIKITQNMNNQFEICIDETNYIRGFQNCETNCISQMILEKDKKYIFRIGVKQENSGYYMIGLMNNTNFNSRSGYDDKMSYYFKLENNQMKYYGGHGIDKLVQGDNKQLDENSILELRVWLEGQKLEVVDYPNYSFKVEIKDEFKINHSQKYVSLYFYLHSSLDKYILKEAYIVDKF